MTTLAGTSATSAAARFRYSPQGTFAFVEGTSTLAVVNLNNKGTATFNTTTLGAGKHPVVARYSGDGHFAAGDSEALTQEVEKASTQVTLTSTLNPAPFGWSGTIKATVDAVAPGTGTPPGTVTFREGEAVLATIPLASGSASLPLKSLPVGSHEITVTYGGSASYEPGAGSITQVITP